MRTAHQVKSVPYLKDELVYCPDGGHALSTAAVIEPGSTFFGMTGSRTMVYCTKCPFHYFPEPPQDEECPSTAPENDTNALQDD